MYILLVLAFTSLIFLSKVHIIHQNISTTDTRFALQSRCQSFTRGLADIYNKHCQTKICTLSTLDIPQIHSLLFLLVYNFSEFHFFCCFISNLSVPFPRYCFSHIDVAQPTNCRN